MPLTGLVPALETSGVVPQFKVILADPPWDFTTYSDKAQKSAKRHYPTMSVDEICALPVGEMAAPGCALAMWGTSPNLPEALKVMEAWGFRYTTKLFSWVKKSRSGQRWHVGLGYYTRANTEDCWLGVKIDRHTRRGKPVITTPTRLSHSVQQLIVAPIREHSRKPDDVYARIEALFPGPYLELFARTTYPGWWSWGNEVHKFNDT